MKELVNASEIARRAGVSREAVSNWAQRHKDFPKPIKAAAGVKHTLRDWGQIEAWLAKRRATRHSAPEFHVAALTDLEHFKAAFRAQVKPGNPADWPHVSLHEKPEENQITIQVYETHSLADGETRLDAFGAGFVFTLDGKFVGAYNWKE